MDRLPVEILQNIFFRSLPTRPRHAEYHLPDFISSPLYISHVCRHWRALCLSFGALWSYLSLHLNYTKAEQHQTIVDVFNTWLLRTNGSPLNFYFHCNSVSAGVEGFHASAVYIVATLLAERRRWKDVDFKWYIELHEAPWTLALDDMPILTSLRFSARAARDTTQAAQVARIDLSRSSNIESLLLEGQFDLTVNSSPIPSLKTCVLRSDAYDDGLTVFPQTGFLRLTPSLQHLSITDFPDPGPLGHSLRLMVTLPYVTTFEIHARENMSAFLDMLCLPALQTLFVTSGLFRQSTVSSLEDLINRSTARITTLSVFGIGATSLMSLLELLPTLEKLNVRHRDVRCAEALQALGPLGNTGTPETVGFICPRLRTFNIMMPFVCDGLLDRAASLIRSALESRCNYLGSFNKAYITVEREKRETAIDLPFTESGYELFKSCFKTESSIRLESDVAKYGDQRLLEIHQAAVAHRLALRT